jgi:sugar transferase EpsL
MPLACYRLQLRLKTVLDRLVGVTALLALLPLLVIIATSVYLTMGRPVVFRQLRAGKYAEPFEILKFRTMLGSPKREVLPDRQRLTPLGRILRQTSLDELPQLWNVVRGNMSLVGPRPLPVSYLERYSDRERRRHEVRPGMTGWAQVSGRNDLSWDERLTLDVWYVENWSLRLDGRILIKTFRAVLNRDGTAFSEPLPLFEHRHVNDI